MNDELIERLAKIIDPEAFGLPDNSEEGTITDRDTARDRARLILGELPRPVIGIFHEKDFWRVACPLLPELEGASSTLVALLTLTQQRAVSVADNALTTATIMREELESRT